MTHHDEDVSKSSTEREGGARGGVCDTKSVSHTEPRRSRTDGRTSRSRPAVDTLGESLSAEDGRAVVDGAGDGERVGVSVRAHHRRVRRVGDVAGAPDEAVGDLRVSTPVRLSLDLLEAGWDSDRVDCRRADTCEARDQVSKWRDEVRGDGGSPKFPW